MAGCSSSFADAMKILKAFVHTIRWEADEIISVELRPVSGEEFPAFTPGSHIDLHLPNGMQRSYSLCNSSNECHRYVIGVLKGRASRGGSRCVHEELGVGMVINISPPRNNFPMHEAAGHTVLVAGGIGITPLLCMARRLHDLGRSLELLYFTRSRRSAAFLDVLDSLDIQMTLHFDDEQGGPPDLKRVLADRQHISDVYLYACGPTLMLSAFEQSCTALGLKNAHVENFMATEQTTAADSLSTFTVELARSKKIITITPAKSILDKLLEAGIEVSHSCFEGVCGSCETRVLAGEPDHRDSVLNAQERAANMTMMVCVSGCKSAILRLDL